MGVPKFFRYISERYPCLSEKLREYQIPEFDNLYLDMNGIVHQCSHPNDEDIQFRLSEDDIFRNIFHYIDILFRMIQPKELFFLAVDGVAPRAKINQQRGRRFRTAKEAEMAEFKAKAKGLEIPKEKRFDSNCITPGTVFMMKLNQNLKSFIEYKISNDKLWQNCRVIFSGSEVPGEGEHKIMDYIRYMKAQSDYNPNTRHCLYGLDADLIMLGLCSHEPHFSLLREEVKFGKKAKRILTPEETNFCLLHLSLLREYIEHEFSPLKEKLSFPFDLEKIIDDWVLMGFLVGNDFIPHLPNLHIAQGALPVLYQVYMEILPTLDGYINEAGTLRLDRFEKLMEKLSRFEIEQFADHYADLKYFQAKTQRRLNEMEKPNQESPTSEMQNESAPKIQNDALSVLVKSSSDMFLEYLDENLSNEDSESSDEVCQMEFVQHKKDYYINKLGDYNIDEKFLRSQAKCYVNAIQWNLHYYYHGCCSWSWFYPHHYAPFITDIKDFRDLKLEFDLGEPFLPFEQLLAVLPSYSKELLPPAFQNLLTDDQSPIIDYYPNNFSTDLNGKKQEWEAVVLIPFINETRLKNAMLPHYSQLTIEEKLRNQYGPFNIFSYSKKALGQCQSIYFPQIPKLVRVELKNREDVYIPKENLVHGLYPGLKLEEYFPGFPTLQHIKHTAKLEKAKVKVFEQPSRGENLVLQIIDSPEMVKIEEILGKRVYVNWPYLIEAQITAVSNCNEKTFLINLDTIFNDSGKLILENVGYESFNKSNKTQVWNAQKKSIEDVYKNRFGINVGTTNHLIHARLFVGTQYIFENNGTTSQKDQWSDESSAYAYQTILRNLSVNKTDPVIYKNIHEIYESDSVCFMLGRPHYGAMGLVMDPEDNRRATRIKVSMDITPEPNSDIILEVQAKLKNQRYMPANICAQALGITSHLLSRITGTIYVTVGSLKPQEASNHNIGLKLKFNKKNEEVPGYTRKTNGQWFYSSKAIDLIKDYMRKFPNLFERLSQNASHDIFVETELFNEGSTDLKDIVAWLKQQSFRNVESRVCGSEMLEPDSVKQLEKGLDEFSKTQSRNSKTIVMQIRPHLLYKPGMYDHLPPDKDCITQLFDRIICVRENFTVPLGYKGVVIGVQKSQNKADTTYDILFDTSFEHGLSLGGCSDNRGYRLTYCDFINISHGDRTEIKLNSRETETPISAVNSWRQPTPQSSPTSNWRNTSAFTSLNKNHNPSKVTPPPEYVSPYPSNQERFKGNYNNRQLPIVENVNWRSPPMMVMPNPPNISSVKLKNQVLGVPSYQSHVPNQRPSHEFQALWNKLHTQPPTFPVNKQPGVGEIQTHPVMRSTGMNVPEDPSAFLKALLKITDESTSKPVPSGSKANLVRKTSIVPAAKPAPTLKPHKSSDTPPLVQQLFDHARQTGKKRSPISYCAHILNQCQMNGIGVPQYIYFPDPRTSLICAEICLPDSRKFIGEPCPSHEQAAESVAKKVYETFKLHKVPKPTKDVLLTPPQDYPGPPNKLWLRGGPDFRFQELNKNNRQVQPPDFRYQEQIKNNRHIQIPQLQQQVQPQLENLQISKEKHQIVHRNNHSSEAKVKSTPFVPLQAQKKNRNTSVQQNMKIEEQKVRGSQKYSQTNNKDNVANVSNSNDEQVAQVFIKEKPIDNGQNETGVRPTTQKSNNTRRSRLAARFNVSTADDTPK